MLTNKLTGIPVSEEQEKKLPDPGEESAELAELERLSKEDIASRLAWLQLKELRRVLTNCENYTERSLERTQELMSSARMLNEDSERQTEATIETLNQRIESLQTSNDLLKAELNRTLEVYHKDLAASVAETFDDYCRRIVEQHTGVAVKRGNELIDRIEAYNELIRKQRKTNVFKSIMRIAAFLMIAAMLVITIIK